MRWFRNKPEVKCQCGHLRCYHYGDKGCCYFGIKGLSYDKDGNEIPSYAQCPCVFYIRGNDPEADAEVKALEDLLRK